jgi:hypothetical protein
VTRGAGLLFWLCLGVTACGDDGEGTVTIDAGAIAAGSDGGAAVALTGAKFSEIFPAIFPAPTNARCDSCHDMPASEVSNGKLHMGTDMATAYNALVGKTAMGKKCIGMPLVVPGKPEMSLLLQKLGPTPPCGSRMPIGGAPITDAQFEMVRSWIAAGAKND